MAKALDAPLTGLSGYPVAKSYQIVSTSKMRWSYQTCPLLQIWRNRHRNVVLDL
jgi:hypothetical protein